MKRIILVGGAFAIALSVLLSGCDQKVTVNPRLELLYSSLRFNLVWFLHSDSLFLGKRKFALSLSRPGAGSRCFLRSTGHSREFADIRLNAHPNIGLKGRVSNIGSILDPNIRTAKVRIEIENPGLMRLGMFVQATFHGQQKQARAVVPASAILHLDDRDWVYVPKGGNTFRRVEVLSGQMVPPDRQEILSGIRAGDRVVTHALLMQHSSEQ